VGKKRKRRKNMSRDEAKKERGVNDKTKSKTKTRSPTLETVFMVEKVIEKNSGDYNKREIWQRLEKKVMWQTYMIIIDYLKQVNKVIQTQEDKLVYIWNPKLANKYAKRKRL
jgi:hypothetical protein